MPRFQDLQVVFNDDHIIVVNKPSGVLSVKGKGLGNSISQAVFEAFQSELDDVSVDQMAVHRLGMDTSGLMVMAKSSEAVRGMNTLFRTRMIERKYEALVAGHVEKDGFIDLPLMRDYDCPPFMRISTESHQQALLGFDPEIVGKKLLEAPKSSLTKYEVVSRESFEGQPVTRVSLTSITGRTHQLNVHLAAFGHPIVGDTTYGINGLASANGGLAISELPENSKRASAELQQILNDAARGRVCIHAKSLKFQHPVTMEEISLRTESPF
jgi:tRNA pseudouridine32 synthase / 23S rRNA pseudouridine746 synthase